MTFMASWSKPRRPARTTSAAVAGLTGAPVNPDPVFLQSTGFVLDPAGQVVVSVYSSGAIGRLVPEDVLGLVRYPGLDCVDSASTQQPASDPRPATQAGTARPGALRDLTPAWTAGLGV
jgi:hypothetical protein